ncbi:hypothetical protein ACT453_59815, partial [Bacillus sp. D-CC]
ILNRTTSNCTNCCHNCSILSMFTNQNSIEEGTNIETIVSMITALPASEWTKEKAKQLSNHLQLPLHGDYYL